MSNFTNCKRSMINAEILFMQKMKNFESLFIKEKYYKFIAIKVSFL